MKPVIAIRRRPWAHVLFHFLILFLICPGLQRTVLAQDGSEEEMPESDSPQPQMESMTLPPPEAVPPPPTPPKALPDQESEIVDLHRKNAAQAKANKTRNASSPAKTSREKDQLTVDYVDEPLQGVLRAIATGFRLNLIPDKDVGDVKVTIHLENIPVMEGLRQLCKSHGLELVEEGSVIKIRRAKEATYSFLDLRDGKLSLDIRNKPIREFIREFSDKTRINVVAAQDLQGQINGQLQAVQPLDGLKALMAANGFDIHLKNGVYLVEVADENDGVPGGASSAYRPPRGNPRFSTGGGDIDVHEDRVNLSLVNSSLGDAIRQIAEGAGLNYALIGEVSGNVTAHLRDVSVDDALKLLLQGTRYAFIRNGNTLLIGDRNINTPSGVALSTAELLYLKYIKVENIEKIFPKTINQENIKVIREQNAVLVSGTGEEIEQVKTFIGQVDLPTPQVLLEVLVVEYSRRQDSQLGIAPGLSNDPGANINFYGNMSGVDASWKRGNWQGAIGFLPPKFDMNLRAMEAKNKAKVLAMPKVTTLNGNKAELKVATTSYYQVSSVNKDGFQNNDFRSFDDGITIEMTPWVTRHGEVNVQISPSIKTAGQPKEDSPAPITNRSITTNVTLMDGQTIALGGLITSQEDNARSFVPILGSIPVLGYLFSYRSLIKRTNELVIYVTPHILIIDSQGVELEAELQSMEKRSGFVKSRDFFKKAAEEAKTDSVAAPDSLRKKP